jgi:hypothetical protein
MNYLDTIPGHLTLLVFLLLVGLGLMLWLEVFLGVDKGSITLSAAKELETLSLGGLFYAMRIAIKPPSEIEKK